MEKKTTKVEEEIKYEELLASLENDPKNTFALIKNEYSKDRLSSLFGYFLANSSDPSLLRQILTEIYLLQNKDNIDNLIDFIMVKDFNDIKTDDVVNLKAFCIKILASYKDKKTIFALLYCLNDKNANYKLRFQAAEALGKIGDKNAVESLINVVSDEDEKSVYVRESAATALGMIGDMRAIDPFLSILEAKKSFLNKFTFLKERVIEALGKINFSNSKRVMSAFKTALYDDSPQVRINAIECLMNINDDDCFELIKTKLSDENEEVVKNAVTALYNMRGKGVLEDILTDDSIPQIAKNEAEFIINEYEEDD